MYTYRGWLSRRSVLKHIGLVAAMAMLPPLPTTGSERGWLAAANTMPPDLVQDTFNGLVAFIVPGSDIYSVAQGSSTGEPGGIDAQVTDTLMFTLDQLQPPTVPLSSFVAAILNQVAEAVNPMTSGNFPSPFARLTFPEKVAVFVFLETDPSTELSPVRPLSGLLPILVSSIAYSEVSTFDPELRVITDQPVGWAISGYAGVSDGRNEFKGYFQDRRRVDSDA